MLSTAKYKPMTCFSGRAIAVLGAGGILFRVLTILSNSVPCSAIALTNGLVGAVSSVAFVCEPLIEALYGVRLGYGKALQILVTQI